MTSVKKVKYDDNGAAAWPFCLDRVFQNSKGLRPLHRPYLFTEPPFVTRSMPHAESSSFPRGTRTVQITPSSMSLAWKAWTASGGDGKKRRPAAPSPAFALYGMRLMRVLPDTRGCVCSLGA